MKTVSVTASKTYPINIGEHLLELAGKQIKEQAGGKVAAIITDDIVDGLYAKKLEDVLYHAGYSVVKHVFANGEQSKNAEQYIKILNFLAENHLTRRDVVVALGGGVVGDIAGFAAASYMRGISFVQIPTTLLAAVDSSVGGKTAINLSTGKNLVGAFYQPDLVICDYKTLDTLSDELIADGCAEVIKYGVIADEELFEKLKSPLMPQIEEVITRCVSIKRDVVCEDECEGGYRAILNYGHTFGHAIEKCSEYTISHGKAVAIGMVMMMRASIKKGYCDPSCLPRLREVIAAQSLPKTTDFGEQELFDAMMMDKKRSNSGITLVLPTAIGECMLHKVSIEQMREYLHLALETEDN